MEAIVLVGWFFGVDLSPLLTGGSSSGPAGSSGPLTEAIHAARQIGCDTLQRYAGQVPMADSFSHGSATRRAKWFQIGLKSGQLAACDAFKVADP